MVIDAIIIITTTTIIIKNNKNNKINENNNNDTTSSNTNTNNNNSNNNNNSSNYNDNNKIYSDNILMVDVDCRHLVTITDIQCHENTSDTKESSEQTQGVSLVIQGGSFDVPSGSVCVCTSISTQH